MIAVIATHDNLLRAIDRFCRADDEMEDLSQAFEDEVEPAEPTCRRWGTSSTTTPRSCAS